MYGKNINIIYHNEANFYHVTGNQQLLFDQEKQI